MAAAAPLAILLIASVFTFGFHLVPLHSLKVGFPLQGACSTQCESRACVVPDPSLAPLTPTFRYGKYCGFLYTGCNGETPCDGIDECCMRHDSCITDNVLNVTCSTQLLNCVREFRNSGAPSFNGSTCDRHQVLDSLESVALYLISLAT